MRRKAKPSPSPPAAIDDLPLCVDLDGTLVKVDTLQEAGFTVLIRDWRFWFRLPALLLRGKAALKQELARRWRFDAAHLPYNEALLEYLREAHARGRKIVLATAADRAVAEPVARHLGLFDEVIASDGIRNLRGPTKAEELCRRFGDGGFVYVGNDRTDHAVWSRAGAVITVNARRSLRRAVDARYPGAAAIETPRNSLKAALRALRPYQWVKNLLTFVPLLASGDFRDLQAWRASVLIFLAFCAIASAGYLINDMADLTSDRVHARKRRRPFAAGALSIADGLSMLPVLIGLGAVLGGLSGAWLALAIYAVLSLAYNFKLKSMPLIDVFVLAALYTVRLFGGGQASGHPVSLWLLGFSSFVFLSLALIKRVAELFRLRELKSDGPAGREYYTEDLTILEMMGCSASFASAIVLALYVQSDTASRAYQHPSVLWGVIPLILFWQCRLWLSTARGYMHDDPIVYAARDWVSWLVFFGVVCVALVAYAPLGVGL